MTALKGTLAILSTVIKDLAFSLIRSVTCICSQMFKQYFANADIVFESSIPEFN